MWEYNYSHQSDELYHYGVLGMKWGVHRARKQYANATTKAERKAAVDKMNTHMEKASKKLNKHYAKGMKKLDKAVKKRYGAFGSVEKYEKAKVKAERSMYKGQKWYRQMEKTFGKQSIVSLSEKDIEMGRRYAKFFEQNAAFENSNYRRYN